MNPVSRRLHRRTGLPAALLAFVVTAGLPASAASGTSSAVAGSESTPAAADAPTTVATATATVYRALPGSQLQFTTSYDGEPIAGRFVRFVPTLRFDPAALADSRLEVDIDLASADTGHAERDEVLTGSDFLDAGGSVRARYVAERFRALGDGRFVADGELTLRGVTRPVPLQFRWTPGAQPQLEGEASVPRQAFGVGLGDWADTTLLPDAVAVKTRLLLAPQ